MTEGTTRTSGLKRGQGFALAGAVAAAWAVFVAPLVLGPLGVMLGGVAFVRGERRGRWVVLAAVVGLGLGLVLNALPDKFVQN
jgi:hypothetical protein